MFPISEICNAVIQQSLYLCIPCLTNNLARTHALRTFKLQFTWPFPISLPINAYFLWSTAFYSTKYKVVVVTNEIRYIYTHSYVVLLSSIANYKTAIWTHAAMNTSHLVTVLVYVPTSQSLITDSKCSKLSILSLTFLQQYTVWPIIHTACWSATKLLHEIITLFYSILQFVYSNSQRQNLKASATIVLL